MVLIWFFGFYVQQIKTTYTCTHTRTRTHGSILDKLIFNIHGQSQQSLIFTVWLRFVCVYFPGSMANQTIILSLHSNFENISADFYCKLIHSIQLYFYMVFSIATCFGFYFWYIVSIWGLGPKHKAGACIWNFIISILCWSDDINLCLVCANRYQIEKQQDIAGHNTWQWRDQP